LEAKMVAQLIFGYFVYFTAQFPYIDQIEFWTKRLGVVAPHNAQSNAIIRLVHPMILKSGRNTLAAPELMMLLSNSIFSVEKFQGSDRDFIISSIGVSSLEQLRAEEEFMYSINRFNVLTSRAKAKFILICSQNFLNYMPADKETLLNASKIRYFGLNFCTEVRNYIIQDDKGEEHEISFRVH